ncbi:hypothetical protein imdm_785 [gamma proteobacterium IMCC2047]|nr:hypothetical protein imdm_785 [gamma proteobacterium IMCC2047]
MPVLGIFDSWRGNLVATGSNLAFFLVFDFPRIYFHKMEKVRDDSKPIRIHKRQD